MSEPTPWVGLAAIVAMVTSPWWDRLLEHVPGRRRRVVPPGHSEVFHLYGKLSCPPCEWEQESARRVPPGSVLRQGPARGELARLTRDGIVAGDLTVREALPPHGRVRELEGRRDREA